MHHSWQAIVAHAARNTRIWSPGTSSARDRGSGCILEHGDGRWLRPGDVVELEVEGIGVLRNTVGAQSALTLPLGAGLILKGVMENLLPIGQFAAASQLSHKALRLYAERGLLPPAWVDPDSGYRYYRPEQLRQATFIALLRRAGVPLAEIKAFVAEPRSTLLLEYEEKATAEFAERRRVLRYVRKLIEEGAMYDVQTKTTGPAAVREPLAKDQGAGARDVHLRHVRGARRQGRSCAPVSSSTTGP